MTPHHHLGCSRDVGAAGVRWQRRRWRRVPRLGNAVGAGYSGAGLLDVCCRLHLHAGATQTQDGGGQCVKPDNARKRTTKCAARRSACTTHASGTSKPPARSSTRARVAARAEWSPLRFSSWPHWWPQTLHKPVVAGEGAVVGVAGPAFHAAHQPARQPLTEEQVWASNKIMAVNADIGLSMVKLMMITRAVEAAHGITGGQR